MCLDNIPAGSVVTFQTRDHDPEKAFLVSIVGKGDERRAKFVSRNHFHTYEWEAYRYNGRWSLGTSADAMKILDYEEVL